MAFLRPHFQLDELTVSLRLVADLPASAGNKPAPASGNEAARRTESDTLRRKITMAYDAFLKIDGITGESQNDKHKGEIERIEFQFGEPLRPAPHRRWRRRRRQARSQLSDFSALSKKTDKSHRPLLFLNCCQRHSTITRGLHGPQSRRRQPAVLTGRNSGYSDFELTRWWAPNRHSRRVAADELGRRRARGTIPMSDEIPRNR